MLAISRLSGQRCIAMVANDPPTVRKYADTSVLNFSVEFKPQVGANAKLPQIAEKIERGITNSLWHIINPSQYIIRDTNNTCYYALSHSRFHFHALGSSYWLENQEAQCNLMREALKIMQVDTVKRAGLDISAWCVIGMSHKEISTLMFGSILRDIKEFEPIFGVPDDNQVVIYGSYKNTKSRVMLTPQTEKQASESVLNIANVNLFIENIYRPDVFNRFQERTSKDCLHIESDFWWEEIPSGDLRQFMREAIEGIERAVHGSIRKIKSL